MFAGQTVFSQLIEYLPMHSFRALVRLYEGNRWVKKFSCHDQLLTLIFAQLAGCDSLRDIEVCLSAQPGQRYHLGIRGQVKRSTLSDANESRDYRIFEEFAKLLMREAGKLYATEKPEIDFDRPLYAFDSTTISLCLKLFPWAKFRTAKAAIKLHTSLALHGNIPAFILISTGKMADVTSLDHLPVEAGAYYLLDKGYIDYARLYALRTACAFFVTRVKGRMQHAVVEEKSFAPDTGVEGDAVIKLTGVESAKNYPEHLRTVKYYDREHDKHYAFLTNNFTLSALTIAQLYKQRWQVELFFKWIKQHLKIKAFFGTSENAVKVQVWTSILTYCLLAIVKKRLCLSHELHTLAQTLRLQLCAKTPLFSLLSGTPATCLQTCSHNQLSLF